MATSPMRTHFRKKQSWNENKENKPSPLIEVPPLGLTPMFANSNVSKNNKFIKNYFVTQIRLYANYYY